MLAHVAASCLAQYFTIFDGISFDLHDNLDLNEADICERCGVWQFEQGHQLYTFPFPLADFTQHL